MIVAMVYCSKNDRYREPLQMARLIAKRGNQAFLFTADKELCAHLELSKSACFQICLAENIKTVTVNHHKIDNAHIFFCSDYSPLVFAATVTATLNKLISEKMKPDILHVFSEDDVYSTLFCKHYLNIPYIYSFAKISEQKIPVTDFQSLGIPMNNNCAVLGKMVFAAQLCAAGAFYIIDESGGTDPQNWQQFLCAFAGRVVCGHPYVDTLAWHGVNGNFRLQRKEKILKTSKKMLFVTGSLSGAKVSDSLPQDVFYQQLPSDLTEQKKYLQAADCFIFERENTDIKILLAAMAAGCVPVSSMNKPCSPVICEEDCPEDANGYYWHPENQLLSDVLAKVLSDWQQRTAFFEDLRVRARKLVEEKYSLHAAANLYESIYQGFAPVKLPFLAGVSEKAVWSEINGGNKDAHTPN